MKYIELYKEQLKNKTIENPIYKDKLFEEYFALNCFLNNFERSNDRLKNLICQDIELLTNENILRIQKSIQIIKRTVKELKESNNSLFVEDSINGIVLFFGDSTVDAHGIMVDNRVYLLIDLLAYSKALESYNPISFLVHEICHPIHYKLNPDMYFGNFTKESDQVIKRMIFEGLATYLSRLLTDEKDEDIFWLGYLDEKDVSNWKAHAVKVKDQFKKPLEALILEGALDNHYQYQLFSITDPNKIWQGRLGYYYGYEIVSKLSTGKNLHEILNMKFPVYMDEIKRYFNLNNISSFKAF